MNIKALNAIEKYGTSEHLEKFGGLYLGKEDEELIRPFVRTAAAIGKPVEHSFYIFEWLIDPNYKLSTETYKEIFKGIEKIGVKPGLYKYLPNVFNKVSTSPDDELAKALTNTLCKVSTKEHIPELQKYAGSENPVVRESIAKIIKTVGHKS
ncbi:MAG: HEAT repeat domain-containing protein [Candidatus Gastranaerophilales bacterium]|nr:HEAT repeat domain-containing protein [Candidatus Gastranaerophilales bacterium]